MSDAYAPPEYTPAGELTEAERAWVTQIRGVGRVLGWRVAGRDPDGHLVAVTELRGRSTPNQVRCCTATFTPAGLVHGAIVIHGKAKM